MKTKTNKLWKIVAGIFLVIATSFGIATSFFLPHQIYKNGQKRLTKNTTKKYHAKFHPKFNATNPKQIDYNKAEGSVIIINQHSKINMKLLDIKAKVDYKKNVMVKINGEASNKISLGISRIEIFNLKPGKHHLSYVVLYYFPDSETPSEYHKWNCMSNVSVFISKPPKKSNYIIIILLTVLPSVFIISLGILYYFYKKRRKKDDFKKIFNYAKK